FNTFLCTGSCYVDLEKSYLRPMLFGFSGLVPTLVVLLFFHGRIFISWFKHVAWWFLVLAIYFVADTNPYSSDILSINRVRVVLFWTALLFVITLIYALIMNKRLKDNS
ncbi:MAG: hypothetical protein WC657_05715, partial [Candidatus Paceibacterota bacterium]